MVIGIGLFLIASYAQDLWERVFRSFSLYKALNKGEFHKYL
jgi:hypothetical protein